MREMINETTRTVEDSQTAQALHGLLSLKAPESTSPVQTVKHPLLLNQAKTPLQIVPG
jgi:hypothetical protein